jgi:hypothetical protein
MNRIGGDRLGEEPADGSFIGFGRIGRSDQLAVIGDSILF